MRHSLALSLCSTLALSSFAMAQTTELTGADITTLVSGNTLYLELPGGGPRGKGPAAIYYSADNKVAAKFPSGQTPKGTWSIKGNSICVVWEDMPTNPCTGYRKTGDKIDVINLETGQSRGPLTKTAPGNPDKL